MKQRKLFTVFSWLTQIILSELVRFNSPLTVRNPSTSHSSKAEKIRVGGFWENKGTKRNKSCVKVCCTWHGHREYPPSWREDVFLGLCISLWFILKAHPHKSSTHFYSSNVPAHQLIPTMWDINSTAHAAKREWFCSKKNS